MDNGTNVTIVDMGLIGFLPSGVALIVYDAEGKRIDQTIDEGDDGRFQRKWGHVWREALRTRTRNWLRETRLPAKTSRQTVADRVSAIEAKKPQLKYLAKAAGGKLRLLVFKAERRLEVHAPGWKTPRVYPLTGFSGTLGPKLKEGDGQIPEGVYGIEYLNPNSSYYLSLKVSYPNAADRRRAETDGRTVSRTSPWS